MFASDDPALNVDVTVDVLPGETIDVVTHNNGFTFWGNYLRAALTYSRADWALVDGEMVQAGACDPLQGEICSQDACQVWKGGDCDDTDENRNPGCRDALQRRR